MITLQPMTQADFDSFLERAVVEYAKDKVRAGNWDESSALERSRAEFERYLPAGLRSEKNFLYMLVADSGEKVGYLWYAFFEKPDRAFILDFEVYEPYRRHGYATQALAALDVQAREQGFKQLGLHVFGHNTAARDLYKKAGYIETNVNMSKEI